MNTFVGSPTGREADSIQFDDALQVLAQATPSIHGAVLMRRDGNVARVIGEPETGLRALASFALGGFEIFERMSEEGGRGQLEFALLRAKEGHLAVHRVGSDHLLFALATADAALGTMVHDLGWCARRLTAGEVSE